MLSQHKVVFVLAPHTDDGELGCGATIAKLIEEGAKVFYIAFSTAEDSVPADFPKDILKTEVKKATEVLGIPPEQLIIFNYPVRKLNYQRQEILEDLVNLKKQFNPDLILLPTRDDIHQDHAVIGMEGIRAFKNTTILGYELLWNNLSFNATAFVKLTERHIQLKSAALKEYQSQHGRAYMSDKFIFSWACTRGVQIGAQYAEAFEIIRLVIG